jgi:hypothetical protein
MKSAKLVPLQEAMRMATQRSSRHSGTKPTQRFQMLTCLRDSQLMLTALGEQLLHLNRYDLARKALNEAVAVRILSLTSDFINSFPSISLHFFLGNSKHIFDSSETLIH